MKTLANLTYGITHDGAVHDDDATATAMLKIANPNVEIIRTRDAERFEGMGLMYDIGEKNSYVDQVHDHHQKNAPKRRNGVPYAAAGLVWKYYGKEICPEECLGIVDWTLIQKIDGADNGYFPLRSFDKYVAPISKQSIISSLTSKDIKYKQSEEYFDDAVEFSKDVLESYINIAKRKREGKFIENFENGFTAEEVLAVAIAREDYKNVPAVKILEKMKQKYGDLNLISVVDETARVKTHSSATKRIWNDIGRKRYHPSVLSKIESEVLENANRFSKNSRGFNRNFMYFNELVESMNYLSGTSIENFEKAVEHTRKFIDGKVKKANTKRLVTKLLQDPKKKKEGNIFIKFPHSLRDDIRKKVTGNAIISPMRNSEGFKVTALSRNDEDFNAVDQQKYRVRRAFPEKWAEMSESELQKATGLSDAYAAGFNGRFVATKTMESALRVARMIQVEKFPIRN